jgi:glyoxylase-like metal-dependent hydrolase (beta-lactamase superfamily II)
MVIQHFFDPATWTLTYVVYDEREKVGVVIDSVTDFDPKSGCTSFRSCEQIAAFIDASNLRILYVMDTHAHADHLTGMPFFVDRYKAQSVIGDRITVVQETFREVFNLGADFPVDGRQFDVLLGEGETLAAGSLRIAGIHTPGHTPACMTYRIGDAVFVGDVIFMPDYGTARCDFPKGSAEVLYDSIQKLYALPESMRVFAGHDYQPGGRPLRFESTIGEEKRANVHLREGTSRAEFVSFRRKRDATLDMPNLIIPSVQVNIRAGELPEPESNGISYLKVPLNRLRSSAT